MKNHFFFLLWGVSVLISSCGSFGEAMLYGMSGIGYGASGSTVYSPAFSAVNNPPVLDVSSFPNPVPPKFTTTDNTYIPVFSGDIPPSAPSTTINTTNTSTTNSSYQKSKHQCRVCQGKGRKINMIYGSGPDKWCSECQKTVPSGHFHARCDNCQGQGYTEW